MVSQLTSVVKNTDDIRFLSIGTLKAFLIKKSLGIAGSEGLKVIVQRLVDAGIAHTPDLMRLFTVP